MTTAVDFNDLDLFTQGRAHDAWRRLRAEAPVAWNPPTPAWPGFWSRLYPKAAHAWWSPATEDAVTSYHTTVGAPPRCCTVTR